jgi:hypothetical protein
MVARDLDLSALVSLTRALVLLAVTLATAAAHAEPRLFVELSYETDSALDACPSEAGFVAMISDELRYDPFRSPAQYRVVARARATGQGMRGLVEWYDAGGERRGERELHYEGKDCGSLARALSFAIAVQIQLLAREQEAAAKPTEVQPAPAKTGVTAPSPPPPRLDQDAPGERGESPAGGAARWQFMLGLGPAAGVGLAPRAVMLGRAFATVRREALGLELGASASLPSRHTTEPGKGFEQRLALGSLAGCVYIDVVSGCTVTKVGKLDVTGFGVDLPRSPAGVVAQLGPRVALSGLVSGRWLGVLYVEALATLVAWEITLNQREVWKTPPLSLSVGGDLAILLE